MPISYSQLRNAAGQREAILANSLEEAKQSGLKTAFLCHSHKDRVLVEGVVNLLLSTGWRVYVDWMDTTMPDRPNRITARKIKMKIEQCSYFLFLATTNSMSSRWCPWEIGYADGVKEIDDILVIPTRDDYGSHHGNEYLDLYRRVDFSTHNFLCAWRPYEETGVFVSRL